MHARTATFLIAALLSTVPAATAKACACCASPGQRLDRVSQGAGDQLAELERVALGKTAELFTGEADVSDVKGLQATTSEYAVDLTRNETVWTLTFKDKGAVSGTLTFRVDQRFHRLEVDLRERTTEPVWLYKEWTITSPVTGTGMFQLGDTSSIALTLQGRGNSCTSSDDFTHWAAVVNGEGFSFHFFGDLAK